MTEDFIELEKDKNFSHYNENKEYQRQKEKNFK